MEMTYYDTRPKDVAAMERRKEAAAEKSVARKDGDDSHASSRKSKVPKRRPLPADPTGAQPPPPPALEKPRKRVPKHSHTQSQSQSQQPPAPEEPPANIPPSTVHVPQQPKQPRVYETPDDLHQQWEAPSPQPPVNEPPPPSHTQQRHQTYQPDPRNIYQDNSRRQPLANNHAATHPQQERQAYQSDPRVVYPDSHGREGPAAGHPSVQPRQEHQPHQPDPRGVYRDSEATSHPSRNPHPVPMPMPQDHFNPPHPTHRYEPSPMEPQAFQPPAAENAYIEPAGDYSHNHYDMQPRHNSHQVAALEPRRTEQPSYRPVSRDSPYEAVDPYSHYQLSQVAPQSAPSQPSHRAHRNSYSNPARNDIYRDIPMRKPISQIEYRPSHEYMQPHVDDFEEEQEEEEDLPPPPPIHRDGLRKPQPPSQPPQPRTQRSFDYTSREGTKPIPMPEPLHMGGGVEGPQYPPEEAPQEYIPYSPTRSNMDYSKQRPQPDAQYSTSPAPSYRSYTQESPPSYERPTTSNGEIVPSSLMAGYDSSIGEDPGNQAMPDDYELAHRRSHASMRSTIVPDHPMRSSPSPIPERTSTRTSPDPRKIPSRKSVSPHPQSLPQSNSMQGTPFGPDSFDVLNPNAASSVAMQAPAAPYDTPQEAMEAARQHEVNKIRELGPIIGNDGRVIDPSDHLPSDTWAPEPDRKPRKQPGVVVRFKHTPHTNQTGPRPSPREQEFQQQREKDREREQGMALARPRSSGTSSYHSYHSSLSNTPQATGGSVPSPPPARSRLGNSRPQSSYHAPSSAIGTDRHSPSPGLSNTARDRDNHPIYTPPHYQPTTASQTQRQRQPSPSPSPRASNFYEVSGPPIPAKVPIHPATPNYPVGGMNGHAHSSSSASNGHGGELDALSEEMKRIDIGVSKYGSMAGSRRPRSSYVGAYGQ